MLENFKNLKQYQIALIPFILNLISKINENSFLIIVLKGKNISFINLYFSAIFSSIILNIFFILIGISLRYFLKTDIINTFFLIILFILYGLMSLIQICRVFSTRGEDDNKLIDYIINSSSDEESEKPRIHIDSDKNEVEIELDTIKLDEIEDERKNNNFNNFRKKKEMDNKLIKTDSSFNNIFDGMKMMISFEFGEKIQIFNVGLSSKFSNINSLILGNICGIVIINAIIITFGMKILQKRINNLFLFLEIVFYLSFASYYIYSIYF